MWKLMGRWCAVFLSSTLLITCVVEESSPEPSAGAETAAGEIVLRNATQEPVEYSVMPSDAGEEVRKTLPAGSMDRYPTEVSLDVTFESGGMQLDYKVDPGKTYAFRHDYQDHIDLFVGSHTIEGVPDLAPYVPTPNDVVEKMLELAEVGQGDVIIDLGCGDGRIVITAAQKYGARGIGVDIDPQHIDKAKSLAKSAGVAHLVEFRVQDATKTELSSATVVSLYLTPDANELIRPKLEQQLEPGSRVVTHDYPIRGWQAIREESVERESRSHELYLYVIGK
jgi:precorrin-6B methylase 2